MLKHITKVFQHNLFVILHNQGVLNMTFEAYSMCVKMYNIYIYLYTLVCVIVLHIQSTADLHVWSVSMCDGLTLVVLILFPEEHIHPELSGRVLHSSPSRHGSISHHHFPITIDAAEGEHRRITEQVSSSCRHTRSHHHRSPRSNCGQKNPKNRHNQKFTI